MFPIFLLLFLLPLSSSAATPAVTSFTVNPTTMDSSYTTVFSWTMEGSSGNNLYFVCPAGVKIFKTDGTAFPCNQRYSAGSVISGSVAFNIINVSGGTVVLNAIVYPKDLNGTDYDAGAKNVYITVNTTPHPITEFTSSSTTTVAADTSVTFSWKAHDIDGVNLQFDCASGVQVFASGSSVPLACSTPALSSSLSVSGSSSFTFTNSSSFETPLTIRALPMIATGLYDATHALSLTLNIAGKTAVPDTLINSFTVPKTQISSGDSLVFSWSAPLSSGVNFQIACSNSVSVMSSPGTTTSTKLPCNTTAFGQSLPAVSSTTLSFINNSDSSQILSLYLLPKIASGTYDGTKSKRIDIVVNLPGQSIPLPVITPPVVKTETGLKIVKTLVFTQYLYKSVRGTQVEALQKFLAQDKTLYPEGLVTGYFGTLSENAVKRFQERYGIARQGEGGYGFVGPKTRAKLNSLEYF